MISPARPSYLRVVSMLFREEARPRLLATVILTAAMALCLYAVRNDYPFALHVNDMRFSDLIMGIVAISAVAQNAFVSEGRYSLRIPRVYWPLPVRPLVRIAPGFCFQVLVALWFGMLWGLGRSILQIDAPYALPLVMTVAVAVQTHAALYWYAAAGLFWGSVAVAVGFGGTLLVVMVVSPVNLLPPAVQACLLFALTGLAWTWVAVRYARDIRLPWTHVTRADLPPQSAVPGMSAKSTPKKPFSSPFWAQVWFEWRRTTMWFPIIVGGGTFFIWFMDGFGEIPQNTAIALILVAVPFFLSYLHNRVTRQYRTFVLSRPISNHRVGRAKTVSTALALLLVALVTEGPRLVADTLQRGIPTLADIVADSVLIVTYVVAMVYGVVALAVQLLQSFLSIPLYVLRYLIAGLGDPFAAPAFPRMDPIPGAGTLATLLAGVILLRSLERRYGGAVRWPHELWTAAAALAFPVLIGVLRIEGPVQNVSEAWYVWVTPCITLSALLVYGLRSRLISLRDAAAGLLIFTVLYGLAGHVYTSPTEYSVYFIDLHFGHWCVLLASPIVWYPFVVASQRYEDI